MGIESGQMLSHYRLVEKLGEGGMGVVWKAEDTVLQRTVAIKVLPAAVSHDEELRRLFVEEARRASSMSDAHIAQVHELGSEEGFDFIVMECVEGQPLNRILQGRPLPPDKVAHIGLQVAQGLARAHRKRLIHRDIKPGNILVTPEDEVKIVDFGLAALFPAEDLAKDDLPTSPLADRTQPVRRIAGTFPYMSPEQVRGEPLDGHSDIFSLGVVLYEMTTGQRPFAGATIQELMSAILKTRPTPVHDLVPTVPLELDRIIQKTLAARRSERYQTMEDLAVDLKRLGRDLDSGSSPSYVDLRQLQKKTPRRWPRVAMIGATLAVVVAAVIWTVVLRTPVQQRRVRTLLILPFEVRGQTEGADYVGRAFAEALAINLAQAESLRILPVPSEREGAGSEHRSSVELASQLGAEQLAVGSLTREGESVAALVTLIDVQENRVVKGIHRNALEGSLDFLAIEVARDVTTEVGARFQHKYEYPTVRVVDAEIAKTVEYVTGIAATRTDDLPAVLDATERLMNLFPGNFDVLVLRAWALAHRHSSKPSVDHLAVLNVTLDRIDQADPKNPYTEIWRSEVESLRGDPEASALRLTRVLDRHDLSDKVRAWALSSRAVDRVRMEDFDAALLDSREAVRLDPTNSSIMRRLAYTLRTAGRYSEARLPAEQAVALQPTYYVNYMILGLVLTALNSHQEAAAAYEKACEMEEGQTSCSLYATALKQLGNIDEARRIAVMADSMRASILGAYNLACFWALDGNREDALRYLRRSVELGYASTWMSRDSDLEILHGDSEFEEILALVKKRLESGDQ